MAFQPFQCSFEEVTGDTTGKSVYVFASKVLENQVADAGEIDSKERILKVMEKKARSSDQRVSLTLAKEQKKARNLEEHTLLFNTLSYLEDELEECISTREKDQRIISRYKASLQSSEQHLTTSISEYDEYRKAADDEQRQANTKIFALEQRVLLAQADLSKANEEAGRTQAELSEANVNITFLNEEAGRTQAELSEAIVNITSLNEQVGRAQVELSKANANTTFLSEQVRQAQIELSEANKHKSSFESQAERMRGVETELRKDIVRADEHISSLEEQVREARNQAAAEMAKANEQEREVKALQEHADQSRTELDRHIKDLSATLQQQFQKTQVAIHDCGEVAWSNELYRETIADQEREINTAKNHNEQLADEVQGLKAALENSKQRNKSANTELDAAKTAARRDMEIARNYKDALEDAQQRNKSANTELNAAKAAARRDMEIARNQNEQLADEIQELKAALENSKQRNKSANTELDAAKAAARRALERADEVEQSLNTAKETHAARVVTLRGEVVALQNKLAIIEKELLEAKARDAKQTQATGARIQGLTLELEQLKESKAVSEKQHELQLKQKEAQFNEEIGQLETQFHAANRELEQSKAADKKDHALQLEQKEAQFREEVNQLETRFRAANSSLEKCIEDLQSHLSQSKDTIQNHQAQISKMSESAISKRNQWTEERLNLERAVAERSNNIVALTDQLQELKSRAKNLEETCHKYAAREDELNSKLEDLGQGLKRADDELRATQHRLSHTEAQARRDMEQAKQEFERLQEKTVSDFKERMKLPANEISKLEQTIRAWSKKQQAWTEREEQLQNWLQLICKKNEHFAKCFKDSNKKCIRNAKRIENLEYWVREFARGGIATAQVKDTLERKNGELEQRVTNLDAKLSKSRRDLKSIVSAREDLVLALYEGLSIESPDLEGNYDSREALSAANARYINLLNSLIGFWKETCEALKTQNSEVEHLDKCLRSAHDTVSEYERQIKELEESYESLNNMFRTFVRTANKNLEWVDSIFVRLLEVRRASVSGEGEETASQEAE